MTEFNNAVMCMVLDKITGKPEQIPPSYNAIVPREDAEAYVAEHPGYFGNRFVIVKLACLVPGEIPE